MAADTGEAMAAMIIDAKKWPPVMGPTDFVDWANGNYYALKHHEDVPQAKALAPSVEWIDRIVCSFYEIEPVELYRPQRGVFNEPRPKAIYLVRMLRHDALKEIGCQFNMEKYNSVSSAIERVKQKMDVDPKLRRRVEQSTKRILKSQEQT